MVRAWSREIGLEDYFCWCSLAIREVGALKMLLFWEARIMSSICFRSKIESFSSTMTIWLMFTCFECPDLTFAPFWMRLLIAGVCACDDDYLLATSDVFEALATEPLFIWADDLVLEAVAVLGRWGWCWFFDVECPPVVCKLLRC